MRGSPRVRRRTRRPPSCRRRCAQQQTPTPPACTCLGCCLGPAHLDHLFGVRAQERLTMRRAFVHCPPRPPPHIAWQHTFAPGFVRWHLLQVDDGLLLEGVQLEGEAVRHARLQRPVPLLQVGHAAGHRPLRVARPPAGTGATAVHTRCRPRCAPWVPGVGCAKHGGYATR
jgi:hypothetical protein